MLVSERSWGGEFFRRAGALGLIASLLWSGAYLLAASRVSLRIYALPFGSAVAHKFASAMTRVAGFPRSVLLLGASSTHDGFDEEVMEASAPGWAFANGGTGMGSIFVYEALTEILREYAIRPTVLVIGLHPVALADREINFNGGGYTDFFDVCHGAAVVAFDDRRFQTDNRRELIWNSVWPVHRLARQSSRLLRYALFNLSVRFHLGEQLPRQAFEVAPDDILPRRPYFYDDAGPLPGAAAEGVRWFEERTREWAAPRHLESLRRTLENASAVSPRVIVVLMPEHSLLREGVSRRLRAPLLAVVNAYRDHGILVLDRSHVVPDGLFRDSVHLVAQGRELLSRQVAADVAALSTPPRLR